ncbi:hypothetical protein CLOP_g40010 [Closterium sp. NIES-67]|nr:hypothetical protein CLOP_g40010 [Closterium sp. NIES-67]
MTKHSREQISYVEVEKHFNLPILEAAARLGVCNATLKRVCRENGVPRWPYRKLMAGKTMDEIKRDAALLSLQGAGTSTSSSNNQSPVSSIADAVPSAPSVALGFGQGTGNDSSSLSPPVLPLTTGRQGRVSWDAARNNNGAVAAMVSGHHWDGLFGSNLRNENGPALVVDMKQAQQQEQLTAVPWLRRSYIT